jgi:hypothetical protein
MSICSVEKTSSVVTALEKSKFKFYKSGASIFNINLNKFSNYFVKDEDDVKEYLLKNGFVINQKHTEAFKRDVYVFEDDSVYVTLVKNIYEEIAIYRYMMTMPELNHESSLEQLYDVYITLKNALESFQGTLSEFLKEINKDSTPEPIQKQDTTGKLIKKIICISKSPSMGRFRAAWSGILLLRDDNFKLIVCLVGSSDASPSKNINKHLVLVELGTEEEPIFLKGQLKLGSNPVVYGYDESCVQCLNSNNTVFDNTYFGMFKVLEFIRIAK